MTTYNNVTENCFKECVNDFTSRKILKQEVLQHCVASWHRVGWGMGV